MATLWIVEPDDIGRLAARIVKFTAIFVSIAGKLTFAEIEQLGTICRALRSGFMAESSTVS